MEGEAVLKALVDALATSDEVLEKCTDSLFKDDGLALCRDEPATSLCGLKSALHLDL